MHTHVEFSTVKYNIFFWLNRISILNVYIWLIVSVFFPDRLFFILMACCLLLWGIALIVPCYQVIGKLVIFNGTILIYSRDHTMDKKYNCEDIKSIQFVFGGYKGMSDMIGRLIGNGGRKNGAGNYLILDNDPGKTFQIFVKNMRAYEVLSHVLNELYNSDTEVAVIANDMYVPQQIWKNIRKKINVCTK